uniref:Gamma-secretase-activating protein C-terminal domain-containing protein n=1 Tax=Callorhinchus milii TaxID=7868 RepID=A0A4W3IYN2_CALMI
MLQLKPFFDVKADVVPWLVDSGLTLPSDPDESAGSPEVQVHIVNVEKNGSILYTWKGKKGTTCIGFYDPHKKQNKLLYTFDREVHLVSCSVNLDRTLLAASVLPYNVKGLPNEFLRPVSRCLTLLIEIHPINNTRVLKAVDTHVRVQFLSPASDMKSFPESHLLVISEDRCIEHFHISVVIEEGYRVMIKNPDRLPKDIVVEDFLWAQWDAQGQRLFCIVEKEREAFLTCTQFSPDTNYETLLSVPLGFPLTISRLCLVSFGIDHFREQQESSETPKLQVFTSHTGGMCMCHSHPVHTEREFSYSVTLLHHGCRKTFTVSLETTDDPCASEPTFVNFDYYVAVYMAGHFLHLINTRLPALTCHDLFLSGKDAKIKNWNDQGCLMSFSDSLLDCQSGKMYKAEIDQQFVMSIMSSCKLDCHRLGALHCAILYFQQHSQTDKQIIDWLCDHFSTSGSFNPIQEFILATLHRKAISELASLDKVLPYSSLLNWDGIQNHRGFWEEMIRNVEFVKVKEGLHKAQYNNISLRVVQDKLFSELVRDCFVSTSIQVPL